MLLLGFSLLPAGHLFEISSAHTEHLVKLRVGQVLVKSRGIAAGGFIAARLQSFEGKLCRRGETMDGGRGDGWWSSAAACNVFYNSFWRYADRAGGSGVKRRGSSASCCRGGEMW